MPSGGHHDRRRSVLGAMVLAPGGALAQPGPAQPRQGGPSSLPAAPPERIEPAPRQSNGPGARGVDPGMRALVPAPDPGTTRVIPPPGTRGGDPRVQTR